MIVFLSLYATLSVYVEELSGSVKYAGLAISGQGVKVEHQGKEIFIEADTIIYAVGMKSNSAEADKFRNCAPEYYKTGDLIKPHQIMQAMHSAYYRALDIL